MDEMIESLSLGMIPLPPGDLDYVATVTTPGSPGFVPPAERIAA